MTSTQTRTDARPAVADTILVQQLRGARWPAKPVCTAIDAEVVRVSEITPHLVRVTVAADEFAGLRFRGSDHYLRLLLPRPGQPAPVLPVGELWWTEMVAMDPSIRPILRNYTVRDLRPDVAELDIDLVRHGDAGPGSRWAGSARIGDRVGIIDQGLLHEIDHAAREYLVIGDETALPAAAGVIAGLRAGVEVRALLEVPSAADVIDLPTAADLDVTWLIRADPHTRPGTRILDTLPTLARPRARVAAWIAGESRMTTATRRHLVNVLKIGKPAICFHGYFRHGRAQYDG